MMQVRSFTRDRWCFHVGPVQVIWMRRPIGLASTEHVLEFMWWSLRPKRKPRHLIAKDRP
jgi:hypothetical protein